VTVKEPQAPGRSAASAARGAAKRARLADALRANLARRKAQTRARASDVGVAASTKKPPGSA
jgi:hypothetical protein